MTFRKSLRPCDAIHQIEHSEEPTVPPHRHTAEYPYRHPYPPSIGSSTWDVRVLCMYAPVEDRCLVLHTQAFIV